MVEKFFALVTGLALLLFTVGFAGGQPVKEAATDGQEIVNQLGDNFAVTVVLEEAQLKESFTVVTALEMFNLETQVGKGGDQTTLGMDGRILFKERQMIIGDRVESVKPILGRYRITMGSSETPFALNGSAYLEENKEVAIAKTPTVTIKLRISRFRGE